MINLDVPLQESVLGVFDTVDWCHQAKVYYCLGYKIYPKRFDEEQHQKRLEFFRRIRNAPSENFETLPVVNFELYD